MGKKQRKKYKDKEKNKEEKTLEQRIAEIDVLRDKLKLLGLTEDLAQITNIFDIMDEYIEKNISMSGTIKIEGYNKKIEYVFPKAKHLKPLLNILNV